MATMFSARHAGLDVVDVVEHVAAAGLEGLHVAAHVLADRFRVGVRQHVLGVDAAAPENQSVAEAGLQIGRVHVGGADLHRVEDVDAVVQQFGDVALARAAGVIPDLGRRPGLDRLHQPFVPRLDDAAVERRAGTSGPPWPARSSPIMITSTTSPTSARNTSNQSSQNFSVRSINASQNSGCSIMSMNQRSKPRMYQQISYTTPLIPLITA